ncbi:MAG: hypothetical protein EOO85_19990 [Pedobacter sp.]|nr:MAG: hypothetical protein EOO85_19990 [Pedobacter sp.]
MLKSYTILILLCLSFGKISAQQFGLFNTNTMFDGFENPAQKTFQLDYSRKYSSNFFLPNFGASGSNKGNNDFFRTMLNEGKYNASGVPLGTNHYNTLTIHSNIYLATLKIFQSYKYQKELGFSWQVRSEGRVDYTNETLAILDSYRRFAQSGLTSFDEAFNNKGMAQSYHQFSFSYRENYDKKLAFGAKVSLLSGITYNRLNISRSRFEQQGSEGDIAVDLQGYYNASFLKGGDLERKDIFPTFKNPGISLTLGTTYTAKSGVTIMANVKDLGVIRWAKGSSVAKFNENTVISPADGLTSKQVENKITDLVLNNVTNKAFYALTNAKVDFLISKAFNYYTPSLILTKNIFYKGGDVALVNKFSYNDFSVSAIPNYNIDGLMLFGAQGMYKTPNFEVYMGSDNLFKSASQIRGAIARDATVGTGYNGASFYMGIGIKFGNTVEHPQNSSTMPGINDNESSFFNRLFSVFSKKK